MHNAVQGYIPFSRRSLEGLHLQLNTGNHAFEVMRNTLHFLLLPDGTLRNLANVDAETWPPSASGSIQDKKWLAMGFDFQKHVLKVFGPRLRMPITKFHGDQVATLIQEQDKLWEAEPLKSALPLLKSSNSVGAVVRALLDVWDALRDIHAEVNAHPANIDKVKLAVQKMRSALATLALPTDATPKPCRMKPLFYEHAILEHLVDQLEELAELGLSLGVLSSRFLEANNRIVKRLAATLRGGGQEVEGRFTHDPLFLQFNRLNETNYVQRRVLFSQLQDKREAEEDSDAEPPSKRRRGSGGSLRAGGDVTMKVE